MLIWGPVSLNADPFSTQTPDQLALARSGTDAKVGLRPRVSQETLHDDGEEEFESRPAPRSTCL